MVQNNNSFTPNATIPFDQVINSFLDPSSIRVKFVTETQSDLVMNVTQKIYFYAYIADEYEGITADLLTANFYNLNATLKAFNSTNP